MKKSFKDLPSAGLWVKKPQTEYEGWEELSKIIDLENELRGYSFYNEVESTYQLCLSHQ